MLTLSILAAVLAAAEPAAAITIRATDDARHVRVIATLDGTLAKEVRAGDVDAETGGRWLRFSVVGQDNKPGAPILGKYFREADELIFIPRYALVPEQRYRAKLTLPGGRIVEKDYVVPPRKASPPAVVERIYPSSDVLPANHLKFYLYFSKPMRQGEAIFERIQLLDERGSEVPDPWRRTELWTPDAKRFSLWIHPGRIKQGVNLREELGPVLEPGKTYTLVIDAELEDADGQPLGKRFTKRFKAAADDEERPLPQNWKLSPPRPGTREPLRLSFGEPLDHALLHRCLEVRDAKGKPMPGEIRLGTNETSWDFLPREAWQSADYTLHVDGDLEDLAGNTPRRVFDTDLKQPVGERPQLTLKFRP
jgi:hypothetical protein